MSARATWKGHLKISLVTLPIKVFPATESSDTLAFHQLHADCQSRISQRKWCVQCGREVTSAEIVKGFEFEKGRYVLLLQDELDAVKPPSTRVIDLVQFAEADQLDPMYIDRTYYLAPDGGPAGAAYAVLRDALQGRVPRVGIGKLALYGREYLVAVRAKASLLLLHTLHHAAEIRATDAIDDLGAVPLVIETAQVKLASQVIDALEDAHLDLAAYTDAYRAGVQQLIDDKIAGKEIVVPVVDTPPVLTLKAALEQSLAAVAATKKPAAKAALKRKRA